MEIKSIDWYDNYVVSNNNVFGLQGKELILVTPEDNEGNSYSFAEFFKLDNRVYFSVKVAEETLYFQQDNKAIKEIEKAVYPEKPKSVYVEMEKDPFKIETVKYNDMDTSRVYINKEVIAYKIIDSFVVIGDGILFSVAESYGTRLEGVYYWEIGKPCTRIKEKGHIW